MLKVFKFEFGKSRIGFEGLLKPKFRKLYLDFAVEQLKLKVEIKKIRSFFNGGARSAEAVVFDARRGKLKNGGIQNSK